MLLGSGIWPEDGENPNAVDPDPPACEDACDSAATQCFETTQQVFWGNCETTYENCISGCGG